MNAIIKEIAEQSYVDADTGDGVYQKFSMQKFAELLIRECASLAYDGPNGILEHFGVEK